jgi:hypothetical protein
MKDMKLLMESWRKFTNEQDDNTEQAPAAPLFPGVGNYEQYIDWLGSNVQDPKTQAFLKAGEEQYDGNSGDDVFQIKKVAIPVVKLKPTQNEIGVEGSLKWPIKKIPKQFVQYAGAEEPITPPSKEGTEPIVTFNGSWVIDGHHRWSTLYACNANAKIVCYNITNPNLKPVEMLKAVQAAIAKEAGKVPREPASGVNLLKSDEATIKGWIVKNAHPQLMELINASPNVKAKVMNAQQDLKEAPVWSSEPEGEQEPEGASLGDVRLVANYVWKNVSVIQKKCQACSRRSCARPYATNWQCSKLEEDPAEWRN